MDTWIIFLIVAVVVVLLPLAVKIVKQYERGVVLRFGRLVGARNPGFNVILPLIDRMTRVSLRIVTTVLEPQEVITKDNVTIKVDAVLYFMIIDPIKAVINVENFREATIQLALTTMRSVLGQSDLDELLAHRDQINARLRQIIDEQTETPWGVRVTLVEIKDALLPESMQRAMARQAEAEREKRAKLIHAEGEKAAAATLAAASYLVSVVDASFEDHDDDSSSVISSAPTLNGAGEGAIRVGS